MNGITIQALDNGPYLVGGPASFVDANGTGYETGLTEPVFLCRCGGSGNKPFCDGTHQKRGFAATERAGSDSDAPDRGRPVL